MAKKKINKGVITGVSEFRPATGLDYISFFVNLHNEKQFDWYFEIGTRYGTSLELSRSKSIAVDPFFNLKSARIIGNKPALHLFQATSDDFFESDFLKRNKIKLSVSFLDGMHLFEYLLRDFMNAEAASDPRGVIAMHDCCPANSDMEQRELKSVEGKAWTGDVWKLIPILTKYRPDLSITVLDCRPTGLVLVSDLDPKNKILHKKYDEILAEFMELRLLDYGLSEFNSQFEYVSASQMANEGFRLFDNVEIAPAQTKSL